MIMAQNVELLVSSILGLTVLLTVLIAGAMVFGPRD